MSPSLQNPGMMTWGGTTTVFLLSINYLTNVIVTSEYGVRPVINLASDVKFTYNSASTKGTASNPYVVS